MEFLGQLSLNCSLKIELCDKLEPLHEQQLVLFLKSFKIVN